MGVHEVVWKYLNFEQKTTLKHKILGSIFFWYKQKINCYFLEFGSLECNGKPNNLFHVHGCEIAIDLHNFQIDDCQKNAQN